MPPIVSQLVVLHADLMTQMTARLNDPVTARREHDSQPHLADILGGCG